MSKKQSSKKFLLRILPEMVKEFTEKMAEYGTFG